MTLNTDFKGTSGVARNLIWGYTF